MTRKELIELHKEIEENKDFLKKRFLFTQLVLDCIDTILKLNPTDDNAILSLYSVEDFAEEIKEELKKVSLTKL